MLQARSWLPRTEGSVRLAFAAATGAPRSPSCTSPARRACASRSRPPARPPEAVLLNTAGGLTGGDRIDIEVALAAALQATVTSAAAEKIYRSLRRRDGNPGPARARRGRAPCLAAAADHRVRPGAARPAHRGRPGRRAQLLAVEMLIFGRAAMGEDVHRGACRDAWRVRRDGRLVFADAFRVDGRHRRRLGSPRDARRRPRGGHAALRGTRRGGSPRGSARASGERERWQAPAPGTDCWWCAPWRARGARCR